MKLLLALLYASTIALFASVGVVIGSVGLVELFIGVLVGSVIDFIWWKVFAYSKYDMDLAFLEHYHWSYLIATLSLVFKVVAPILIGVSIVLILDEAVFQKHPFAYGSNHFMESTLVSILLLAVHAVVLWCIR